MSNPRREFLSWLGASSVLAATASLVNSDSLPAQTPVADNKWDVSWTDRVTGKYKAVFDSPQVSDGGGMFRACIWRDQHKAVYGTPRSDTTPVLVVRHAAMSLIMDDEYWDRFDIGKAEKMKDPATKKWYKRNPVRAPDPKMTGTFKEYNLTDFMAQGGIVLGCGLAFFQVISRYRKADKLSQAEGDKAARAHMVPGVILQPSGIFAVLRAQELGCHYILATDA